MRYGSADELRPDDVGARVTIRHRLDDGTRADVIGILDAFGPVLRVRTRDGTVAEIAAERVIAVRIIGR